MPIYDTDMSYEDMRKAEATHRCFVCKAGVSTCWGESFGYTGYILRCTRYPRHSGLERILQKGREMTATDSKTLTAMGETRMQERVHQAFPKDLTAHDRAIVVKTALEYGLDPLMGELMVYQGKPFVTLDARRRKAQETEKLDGVETRPATREEYDARRIPEEDYLHRADVHVKGATHPFVGWGRIRVDEMRGKNPHLPIVNDPQFMAEKRAEAHALRRAFHLPLPSAEEMCEGEYQVVEEKADNDLEQVRDHLWQSQDAGSAGPPNGGIDPDWLAETCSALRWSEATLLSWLHSEYKVITEGALEDVLARLSPAQRQEFVNEMESRLAQVPA